MTSTRVAPSMSCSKLCMPRWEQIKISDVQQSSMYYNTEITCWRWCSSKTSSHLIICRVSRSVVVRASPDETVSKHLKHCVHEHKHELIRGDWRCVGGANVTSHQNVSPICSWSVSFCQFQEMPMLASFFQVKVFHASWFLAPLNVTIDICLSLQGVCQQSKQRRPAI